MSKQKIMYIIAAVLLVGGSVSNVSAESLVDTSINEVQSVISENTLSAEISTSQQNTEKNDEKISQAPKTGDMLSTTVDTLIAGTIGAGIDSSSEDFCKVLDGVLMKQSDASRASLAWNSTSYQKNINLKYQGEDGSRASLHESTQDVFKNSSETLKSLTPRSDKAIDAVMLSRYQAITRSALIEMNMNLKAKTLDSEKANEIASLLSGSMKCVEEYVSTEGASSEKFASVKSSFGEVLAGWDANKNSFGVDGDVAVKEPFYLKVSSKEASSDESSSLESADQVATKDDLAAYVKSAMVKDGEIKNVIIDDTSVSLNYATKAKLFGFIPVWLTPKTTVSVDGSVKVKYPWYSSLSSKKTKISEDKVKEDLVSLGLISSESSSEPVSEMSMQYRAQLVETLGSVIKSNLEPAVEEVVPSADDQVESSEPASEEGSTGTDEIELAPQA